MAFYASHQSQHPRVPHSPDLDLSPASSLHSVTPPGTASPGSPGFLTSSVSSLWGGFKRRFTSEPSTATSAPRGLPHAHTFQPDGEEKRSHDNDGIYTPQYSHRTGSPMYPPPLEPLQLLGFSDETKQDARLLTAAIAEEIRIMVPARLGIVDEWRLVYSLEQDGASLATLYDKCARYQGMRVGFVLCVKDCEGGLFGAYLSEYPRPAPKYFGTGECFLWRASVLSPLPPPPSATDDTLAGRARTTTVEAPPTTTTITATSSASSSSSPSSIPSPDDATNADAASRSSTAQSIRFKAFPYSGVNEYYMLCEAHFLSLGAGDGKYGLWLDDSLERGVSSTSQTFGNEPLSDEGEKFGVLGVEMWVIGA